jgi:SAM-dependent methyltransferase
MKIFNFNCLTKKESLDDLSTAQVHAEKLEKNLFLRKLYADFYKEFVDIAESDPNGLYIEIGSGMGFIKKLSSRVKTSDIRALPGLDLCFSAEKMPFEDASVSGIFMLNVFHHIKDPEKFLGEIQRCLKKGGKIIMIEPANTIFSRFIYKNFHHEPFNAKSGWEVDGTSHLGDANGALPWIVFFRDIEKFQKKFPKLKVIKKECHTPFRYILSGGFSSFQMMPSFFYGGIKKIETILSPFNNYTGMFLTVEMEKTSKV